MKTPSISIQFLGTGNAWSKPPVNFNTNAIVHYHDHSILIDCGLLCPLALSFAGISQTSIDAIFISHLHGDHVLGLEELLFTRFFACASRHHLWLPEPFFSNNPAFDGSHIWNNCLRAAMETFLEGRSTPLALSDYTDIHTVSEFKPFDIFDLNCEIFPVEHALGKPAYGIIFDNQIAFTSDTKFSLQRIENLLNRGIHTIFHEVTFMHPFPGNIHSSIDELATLPREIAEHILLMHYSDLSTQDDFKRAEDLGFRIAKKNSSYDF